VNAAESCGLQSWSLVVFDSGYLYRVFGDRVNVVQVCSEMIETGDFPRPDSAAAWMSSHQKRKLNDSQRVNDVTVHHQIREPHLLHVRMLGIYLQKLGLGLGLTLRLGLALVLVHISANGLTYVRTGGLVVISFV